MKYFNTPLEEQETTINILYDEEIIQIYSNRVDVIKNLIEKLGAPTEKYKKNQTYWSGAVWNIKFKEKVKVKKILSKEIFIDSNFKEKEKDVEEKDGFDQILIKF